MSVPSLKQLKDSTEKAVRFTEWLVEVLRGKNWAKKLLLADVLLFALFHPDSFPSWVVKSLTSEELPKWYPHCFWSVIILLFIAALIVALRTLPRKTELGPVETLTKRSAIKGLRPFGFEDAELFASLERKQELQECIECIKDRDFRFGILCGESGCGKTSFLQAGLWPTLHQPKARNRCIYVKFTNADPLDSIRQALNEQIQLPMEKFKGADFFMLLGALVESEFKTAVLLFDQFEQFFVHHKLKQERDPFVQALAQWYELAPSLPVKILVCVRGDFFDRLIELQKAMGCSLGPHDSFRLEKFTPEQTTKIFRIVAETEGIAFDKKFVEEIAQQELASRDDGLVSPVDVQILAWIIRGQKTAEERAFNRTAYQKLGGVEGLLERFLARALGARESERRRQVAIKVMLALTDLERNTRAGLLTLETLKKELAGTAADAEVDEAVAWLARGDVRLITPSKQNGTPCYELAHERLILPLRRLAGKELSLADRANQLLDRRANEWLGNNRASRYLFTWRELRLIERQRPYLFWGGQKRHKEALLSQSKRRWRFRSGEVCLVGFLAIFAVFWWYSPWGQIWQVKRDVVELSGRIQDGEALSEIAIALERLGNFQQALKVADQIPGVLAAVAMGMAKSGEATKNPAFFTEARQVAEQIPIPRTKAEALAAIAEGMVKSGEAEKAPALFMQARQVAEQIPMPRTKAEALAAIAEGMVKSGEATKNPAFFTEARQVVEQIRDPETKATVLAAIAEGMVKSGEAEKAPALFAQALQLAEQIRDPKRKATVLVAIAERMAKSGEAEKAPALFMQARQVAEQIPMPRTKAEALAAIAEGMVKSGEAEKAPALFAQALQVAGRIEDDHDKTWTLAAIAEGITKSGEATKNTAFFTQMLQVPEQIDLDSRDQALAAITEGMAKSGEATKDPALFTQALQLAEWIPDGYLRAQPLAAIAEGMAKSGEATKNPAFFTEARQVAEEIIDPYWGALALAAVAETTAKSGRAKSGFVLFTQALQLAEQIRDPKRKATVLAAIAERTAKSGEGTKNSSLFTQMLQVAEQMQDFDSRVQALGAITEAAAKSGEWRQARHYAEWSPTDRGRAVALARILQVWAARKTQLWQR